MNNEVITKVVENTQWITIVVPYFLGAVALALCAFVVTGIIQDRKNQ